MPTDRATQPRGEPAAVPRNDEALVAALRSGDERAFASLVEGHGPAMLRFAHLFTRDEELAQDAVQDSWIAVLNGIDRFEGRAALRTWIFGILLNRLRARIRREERSIPFSRLGDLRNDEPTVDPERFLPADHPRWPHHWAVPPKSWGASPEDHLLSAEVRELVDRAIATLPPGQRAVVTVRDVEGWSAPEACEALGISDANQRVLLHRARAALRRALDDYFTRT